MSDETALKIPTKPPIGGLKKGILANKANFDQHMASVDPKTVPNRLGLIVDDSGSMGDEGMKNAHAAIQSFTGSCNMKDTSIAIYPLNEKNKPLTNDYDLINLYVTTIQATGGTRLYSALERMIEEEPITRAVAFSDGGSTDSTCIISDKQETSLWAKSSELATKVIGLYRAKEIAIDTIFIGKEGSAGYDEMKELARLTNGTFINFKDTKSLSTGLKYLSPKYRALLANPEVKARIERGEHV